MLDDLIVIDIWDAQINVNLVGTQCSSHTMPAYWYYDCNDSIWGFKGRGTQGINRSHPVMIYIV